MINSVFARAIKNCFNKKINIFDSPNNNFDLIVKAFGHQLFNKSEWEL